MTKMTEQGASMLFALKGGKVINIDVIGDSIVISNERHETIIQLNVAQDQSILSVYTDPHALEPDHIIDMISCL